MARCTEVIPQKCIYYCRKCAIWIPTLWTGLQITGVKMISVQLWSTTRSSCILSISQKEVAKKLWRVRVRRTDTRSSNGTKYNS